MLRVALGRLWASTIWAPGAIPITEGELARDVKRWVLPVLDAILIGASILGLHGGMPSFEVVYSDTVSALASLTILTASVVCLIGIAFPRLWAVEFAGKCLLLFLLGTYAVLLLTLSGSASPTRGFVAGVTFAVCVLPVWRIIWLGREHRKRKAAKRRRHAQGGA